MSQPADGFGRLRRSTAQVLSHPADRARSAATQLMREDVACDGVHPGTGQACVLPGHRGCHQTVGGLHWLDD